MRNIYILLKSDFKRNLCRGIESFSDIDIYLIGNEALTKSQIETKRICSENEISVIEVDILLDNPNDFELNLKEYIMTIPNIKNKNIRFICKNELIRNFFEKNKDWLNNVCHYAVKYKTFKTKDSGEPMNLNVDVETIANHLMEAEKHEYQEVDSHFIDMYFECVHINDNPSDVLKELECLESKLVDKKYIKYKHIISDAIILIKKNNDLGVGINNINKKIIDGRIKSFNNRILSNIRNSDGNINYNQIIKINDDKSDYFSSELNKDLKNDNRINNSNNHNEFKNKTDSFHKKKMNSIEKKHANKEKVKVCKDNENLENKDNKNLKEKSIEEKKIDFFSTSDINDAKALLIDLNKKRLFENIKKMYTNETPPDNNVCQNLFYEILKSNKFTSVIDSCASQAIPLPDDFNEYIYNDIYMQSEYYAALCYMLYSEDKWGSKSLNPLDDL